MRGGCVRGHMHPLPLKKLSESKLGHCRCQGGKGAACRYVSPAATGCRGQRPPQAACTGGSSEPALPGLVFHMHGPAGLLVPGAKMQ